MDKNLRRAAYAVVSLALVGILVFRFFPHLVGLDGGSRKTHTAACDKAVQDKICQNYNKCTVKVHLPNCGVDPEVVTALIGTAPRLARGRVDITPGSFNVRKM